MKKGIITFVTLVLIFSVSSCAFNQQPATGDQSGGNAEISSSEEHDAPIDICDLSKDQIGEDVRAVGTIAFMDENNEGTFAELEGNGCKVGIFVPKDRWDQWDKSTQDALQLENVVEAWGILVSFDGQIIIDLAGMTLSSAEEIAEVLDNESPEVTKEPQAYTLPEPPESILLDVPLLYSGVDELPGLCYLGSAGMLVNYEHPELDFADIIALSGMGSSALHLDFPEMPSMLISPYTTQSVVFMMNNLGADFVLGIKEDGKGSDSFQPAGLPYEENAAHLLTFADGEAALAALKQAVGAGKPVMVYLNLYYVHDDFAENSVFWRDFLGKDHASHYMVIKGYDEENLFFNDPTDPTDAAGDLAASTENFLLAWEDTTEIPNAPEIGPFWMLFMDTPGDVPSPDALIELNREKAVDAPAEIRKFSENPDNSEYTRFLLLELGNARLNFGEYLSRNGHVEAGTLYMDSGTLLSEMALGENVQAASLVEVADLEESALSLLTE